MELRHSSTCGNDRCHCGKPATVHIRYGSGCGNVCNKHARAIQRVKGPAATTGPVYLKESAK